MTGYQSNVNVPKCGRQCAATERELRPGEKIISALFDEGGRYVRKDYAVDAWSAPPEGTIAFWMGRIPESDAKPKPTINDGLLMDFFDQLGESEDAEKIRFRYVLALLLMRRKRLKFEDLRRDASEKAGEPARESMILRCSKSKRKYAVLDPRLSEDELAGAQDEVFRVLGWE